MSKLTFTPSLFYKYDKSPHWIWHDSFTDPELKGEISELAEKLIDQGHLHGRNVIADLKIAEVDTDNMDEAVRQTQRLMTEGAELIYQGGLEMAIGDVRYVGRPDLLEKRPGKSRFGNYYYAPIDIKSTAKLKRPQGRIGADASGLLGAFLLSGIELAAQSRADLPANQRNPFFVYVDELGTFATESLGTMLSEARKYRVGCTLACQFMDQLDESTRYAIIGNCGSLAVFNCGSRDAETLAGELGGDVTPADLVGLPRHTAYLRLLINNTPSRPFSIQTLPPRSRRRPDRSEVVRRVSRGRYAQPAAIVDKQIARQFSG